MSVFLFKNIRVKFSGWEQIKHLYKKYFENQSQEMMMMKQYWPYATNSKMTKHFHNVITFHVKPSKLQYIFSEVCSVVVVQVNCRAFKVL